jgi:hypothetical protein
MSLQVSAAPVFPIFPGNENPYLAWRAFYRNLIDTFARAPVLSQHGKGLLGALLTPEQYARCPVSLWVNFTNHTYSLMTTHQSQLLLSPHGSETWQDLRSNKEPSAFILKL